ncbi:MAG: hypothetical protein AB1603_07510 [Chloroflexota bacterium]
MAAEKTCQVCGKSDAIGSCEQCGKALCEICRKGYFHQELGPANQTLGMQLSQIWSGEKTMYYCPECFKTIDVYEHPRGW